jgi:hypothetical protein
VVHSYDWVDTSFEMAEKQSLPSHLQNELSKYGTNELPLIVLADNLNQEVDWNTYPRSGLISPDNTFIVINTNQDKGYTQEEQVFTLHHELATYLLAAGWQTEQQLALIKWDTDYSNHAERDLEKGFVSREATNSASDDFSEIAFFLMTDKTMDGTNTIGQLINNDNAWTYDTLKAKVIIVQNYLLSQWVSIDPSNLVEEPS